MSPSERWGDPRLKLLRGEKWRALRPQVCRSLGRSESAEQELERLARCLDEGYQRAAAELPTHADVRIERDKGHDRFVVTPLDRLEEPDSLVELKSRVDELLPRVDLPESILEIAAQTGFTQAFTHISERNARVGDLGTSVCAVMTAQACNTGLTPVIHEDVAALTRRRLTWVDQNYIRMETIAQANAQLVNYQANLPLARQWGGGEVASADGLRFRTLVRTVHAGRNPKYFNRGRGVTYLNFMSGQLTGFHGIVVPGTLRDSLYILEGQLEHQTSLDPKELMTEAFGVRTLIFRFALVLGHNVGLMKQLLFPFRLGLGGPVGDGKQHFCWIHINELINAYIQALGNQKWSGVYHLCAAHPVTNLDFTRSLVPGCGASPSYPLRVPRLLLKLAFGEGAEVMTSCQCVISERLPESGFRFRYLDLEAALRAIADARA